MSRWRLKSSGACCPITRPSAMGAALAAVSLACPERRRRLLRLSRSRRPAHRDRAGRHRRQGRGRGAHHGRRAGVAEDRRRGGETSLPDLAAKMNGFLHRSTGSNSYATFFYAQLDERSRQLRYVNAGHNPPYLVRDRRRTRGRRSESGAGDSRALHRGDGAGSLSADDLRRGDRRNFDPATCSWRSRMASPKR